MQRVSLQDKTLLCAIRCCHLASTSCSPQPVIELLPFLTALEQTSRAGVCKHCSQCQTWGGQLSNLLGWRVDCLVLAATWTYMALIRSHGKQFFSACRVVAKGRLCYQRAQCAVCDHLACT